MKINLGCGADYREGYVNVDCDRSVKADMYCKAENLSTLSWVNPIEEIRAWDVLEHVQDLVAAMSACVTVLQEGGLLHIHVPHDLGWGAWADPTHVRAFNETSFRCYTENVERWGWETHRFGIELLQLNVSPYGKTLKVEHPELYPRAVDSMEIKLRKVAL